jgi:hypothetical protein
MVIGGQILSIQQSALGIGILILTMPIHIVTTITSQVASPSVA